MKARAVRIVAIALVVLLLLQGLTLTAFAGPPAGAWVSAIQVQNVDQVNPANITVTFYWAQGTTNAGQVAYSFTDVIPAGKSTSYYVPSLTEVPTNFVGSVVVSSDVEVAAILNTSKVAAGSPTDPKRIGSAVGVSEPSTTVYAPYLRKNYANRNSYIAVQNTSDTAAMVYVKYTDSTGVQLSAADESISVPAFSTKIFYQNDNALLPNGFSGSAVITSTVPLAVMVNNANAGTDTSTAGFESYNGFASTSSALKLYLPKVTVNFGNPNFQTGLQIQNAGNAAATMSISFKFGTQVYTKTSGLIQPGAAWSIYLASSGASGIPSGTSGTGSAIVESLQPMVAVVVETRSTGLDIISLGVADGSGTNTVLFPKFDSHFSASDYNGGIQVQNIGTEATTFRATFSQAQRADVVVDSPLVQPGDSFAFYGPNVTGLTTNFSGSVVVVSLANQPIAGVYTSRSTVISGDSYVSYNGIQK